MPIKFIPVPRWAPPARVMPSADFHGEASTAPIHEAVGRALSAWEHAESAFIKLYQLLCESVSFAPCRAYGTIESVFGRHLALKYAAEEFFLNRDKVELKIVLDLIKVYNEASTYRNQIAHGMAMQPHMHGYFLSPASYSSRRRETPRPDVMWGFGASYFYRVKEIDHCSQHFTNILNGAMTLAMELNSKYDILEPGEFHP
jgi:hypothetical protein